MKILVTGATGFVGKNIVAKLLDQNHTVGILCRPTSNLDVLGDDVKKIEVFPIDPTLQSMDSAFKSFQPEMVIHLAALYISEHRSEEVAPLINSNLLFGGLLLEVMKQNGCKKIITTGTSWQHFENKPYSPVNLYAATKQAFENLLEFYIQACQFKAISFHLYDTYGANDHRKKLVHVLKERLQSGEKITMPEGNQGFNIMHVDDVTEAYMQGIKLLDQSNFASNTLQTYALKAEEDITLKEFVELFEEVKGKKLNISWGDRPYRAREVMKIWDNGQILDQWKQKIPLKEGLKSI